MVVEFAGCEDGNVESTHECGGADIALDEVGDRHDVADGGVGAGVLTAGESAADTLPGDSLPFASASFRATHHSFSGNINGARGSITEQLDLKDDLTDNPSLLAGNLTALNRELREVFGARLLPARDVPGVLPAVGSLRAGADGAVRPHQPPGVPT
jgi:hypothetical protein